MDEDNVSGHDIFLKPSAPDNDMYKRFSVSGHKSVSGIGGDLDEDGNNHYGLNVNTPRKGKYAMAAPTHVPTTTGFSKEDDNTPALNKQAASNEGETSRKDENSRTLGFSKNEGKLIFKITRVNKVTQKENLLTKNKRIISRCPHTSQKYYAKGMCKKCYHNFGREK